jgi:hypothetical protein
MKKCFTARLTINLSFNSEKKMKVSKQQTRISLFYLTLSSDKRMETMVR